MIDATTSAARQDQTDVSIVQTIIRILRRLTDPEAGRELSARLRRVAR